jgi:hypothetical protein
MMSNNQDESTPIFYRRYSEAEVAVLRQQLKNSIDAAQRIAQQRGHALNSRIAAIKAEIVRNKIEQSSL